MCRVEDAEAVQGLICEMLIEETGLEPVVRLSK
jgi:hypothetical protein